MLPPKARLPLLLLLGMVALLGGIGGGLMRLGFALPAPFGSAAGYHGPLLAAAFFGVVIGLERAVALGAVHWYLAPLACGIGGVALLAGAADVAVAALALGALVFFAGSVRVVVRLPALFTLTLALGAAAGLAANAGLWLGHAAAELVPLWLAFFVLTIAGERLELTRMAPPRRAARALFVALLVASVPALTVALGPAAQTEWWAAALLGFALWLLAYDIARRNLRQQGLPRFVAVCLVTGYLALALGAVLGLGGAFAPGHAWRDAALHLVLLGFVFSMVIGHAPIIFPAVMRAKIPYHPAFYLPLLVLHTGLALRVAGVLLGDAGWRRQGATMNAAALALLIVVLLSRVAAGRREARA